MHGWILALSSSRSVVSQNNSLLGVVINVHLGCICPYSVKGERVYSYITQKVRQDYEETPPTIQHCHSKVGIFQMDGAILNELFHNLYIPPPIQFVLQTDSFIAIK